MRRKRTSSRVTAVGSTTIHPQPAEHVALNGFFDTHSAQSSSSHTGPSSHPQTTNSHTPLSSSSHRGDNHPSSNSLSCAALNNTAKEASSFLQDVRQRIFKQLEDERSARGFHGQRKEPSKLSLHRQRALQIAFGLNLRPRAVSGGDDRSSEQSDPHNMRKSAHSANDPDDLIVSSVEFSLVCPYSRLPMQCPVRSSNCHHLQCCELESWIVLMGKYRSLRDPKAPCPVCEQRVPASSLEVDVWMQNVLEQMPVGTHLVVLDIDGSYCSGDESRQKRKEGMITELIDATQADYADRPLGEVIDEMSGEEQGGDRYGKERSGLDAVPAIGAKHDRAASPSTDSDLLHDIPDTMVSSYGTQFMTPFAHSIVKKEMPLSSSANTSVRGIAQTITASQASSSDDNSVKLLYHVPGRALPSQLRLWIPYCMHCSTAFLKGETAHAEVCSSCGYSAKEHRTLVRRFANNPEVTMELTPDDTLILCGVDAIAAYLYRAGFQRYVEPQSLLVNSAISRLTGLPALPRRTRGVWSSSRTLTRFELDFLEACCERVANDEGLEELKGMMVPKLFRIPRQQRSHLGFSTQRTRFEKIPFPMQTPSASTL